MSNPNEPNGVSPQAGDTGPSGPIDATQVAAQYGVTPMGEAGTQYARPGKRNLSGPGASKPWYKKWWVWVIIILLFFMLISRCGSKPRTSSAPVEREVVEVQSEPAEVEEVDLGEAPSQVGELLTTARANLELEGYTVETVSDDGKSVLKEGNWTVISQKQSANTVLLTVSKDTEESEPAAQVSTEEQCLALAEPLQEANLGISAVLEDDPDDPQAAVEVWRAIGTSFEKFGKKAKGSEAGDLSIDVGRDAHRLADAMEKLFVKDNLAATGEYALATQAFYDSYGKLLDLCD